MLTTITIALAVLGGFGLGCWRASVGTRALIKAACERTRDQAYNEIYEIARQARAAAELGGNTPAAE